MDVIAYLLKAKAPKRISAPSLSRGGRGGSQDGHAFRGNQYVKVAPLVGQKAIMRVAKALRLDRIDTPYVFHGTDISRLSNIAKRGLEPSPGSWTTDPPAVHFTDSYLEAIGRGSPSTSVMLAVRRDAVKWGEGLRRPFMSMNGVDPRNLLVLTERGLKPLVRRRSTIKDVIASILKAKATPPKSARKLRIVTGPAAGKKTSFHGNQYVKVDLAHESKVDRDHFPSAKGPARSTGLPYNFMNKPRIQQLQWKHRDAGKLSGYPKPMKWRDIPAHRPNPKGQPRKGSSIKGVELGQMGDLCERILHDSKGVFGQFNRALGADRQGAVDLQHDSSDLFFELRGITPESQQYRPKFMEKQVAVKMAKCQKGGVRLRFLCAVLDQKTSSIYLYGAKDIPPPVSRKITKDLYNFYGVARTPAIARHIADIRRANADKEAAKKAKKREAAARRRRANR